MLFDVSSMDKSFNLQLVEIISRQWKGPKRSDSIHSKLTASVLEFTGEPLVWIRWNMYLKCLTLIRELFGILQDCPQLKIRDALFPLSDHVQKCSDY